MSEKLYTEDEVADLTRLARAQAVKEAADLCKRHDQLLMFNFNALKNEPALHNQILAILTSSDKDALAEEEVRLLFPIEANTTVKALYILMAGEGTFDPREAESIMAEHDRQVRLEGAFDVLMQIRGFRKRNPMDQGISNTLEFIGVLYRDYEKALSKLRAGKEPQP
jgi:hypothetical protein